MFPGSVAPTVAAVVRDLASSNAQSRVAAADAARAALGRAGDQERGTLVDALVRALKDKTVEVRAAAVLALADVAAFEALPAILVVAEDESPLVRQLAITALGEIGDVRALERIRRALVDVRPEVRFQAIVAFPRLAKLRDGHDDAWSALGRALDDDDAQVRARAAEACSELAAAGPMPTSITDRLAVIANAATASSDERVAAAIALGESRDDRGGEVLLGVVSGAIDEPDAGRVQAAFELAGELGLKAAREAATSAAFGLRARFGDAGRRTAALVALVRLGDRRGIDHVMTELQSTSFTRCGLAIGVAVRAGLVSARPVIATLATMPNRADPEAVADALERLDAIASPPRP